MDRNNRIGNTLIQEIEKEIESKVIVYFTGDRPPFGSRIAEDAVRPLYDHLIDLKFEEENRKIALYFYSRGGDVSVPWRIVSMIREFCDEFNVLIPYRAQSAATLLSLGSDTIVMGKKAELGPIDPTLVKATMGETATPPQEIPVEDINSFLSFVKERANITDQNAIAQVLNSLIEQIGPSTLGNVNRQHYHIRLVGRKLLTSRKEKIDEEKISTIIETLTEKIYSHGHAIGRREAKDIGLPIIYPESKLEDLMWELYLKYEDFFKLQEPIHPEILLKDKENDEIHEMPIAVIESANRLHIFKTNVDLKKKRKIPPSPQININLGLQLPAGIQQQQIPQKAQQILNQITNQISQQVPKIVQEEIVRQSPVIGFVGRAYGGKWYEGK